MKNRIELSFHAMLYHFFSVDNKSSPKNSKFIFVNYEGYSKTIICQITCYIHLKENMCKEDESPISIYRAQLRRAARNYFVNDFFFSVKQ